MTLTRKGLIFFLRNPESGVSHWGIDLVVQESQRWHFSHSLSLLFMFVASWLKYNIHNSRHHICTSGRRKGESYIYSVNKEINFLQKHPRRFPLMSSWLDL